MKISSIEVVGFYLGFYFFMCFLLQLFLSHAQEPEKIYYSGKDLDLFLFLSLTSLCRNRKYNFVQSSIQETWVWFHTFGNGTKILSLYKEVFLFFPKIMLFENNTALGYDIAWDNALTNIFYNLRYSFMPMEHYHIWGTLICKWRYFLMPFGAMA